MNMMRKTGLLTTLAAFVLSACGGGSPTLLSAGGSSSGTTTSSSSGASSSTSSSSGGVAATAATITMISSVAQIASNNSTPATITAIVQDANNVIVIGAPISFAATSGVIAPSATTATGSVAGTTDSNGQAQATLTTPGNFTNRAITVTATVGTVSKTLVVMVTGSKLSVSGPTSLITGAVGTFSASLADSAGTGIPNQTVTIASANGNALSAGSMTTDNTGHITFTLTGSKAGIDTVTATSLGLSATATISVSGESFNLTAPAANTPVPLSSAATSTQAAVSHPQAFTLLWTNAGVPVQGATVTFSTTRGVFGTTVPAPPATGSVTTTAQTDSNGGATVSVLATTAGPAVVTATATDPTTLAQVTTQLQIEFVATNPSRLDTQASPRNVAVSGQSTITAIVRDVNNNFVEGQTVSFQLTDQTGGSISVATSVTNAQGVAQTVYQATSAASGNNGVVITATLGALSSTITLTVGGQTVFLSLGTGNLITAPNATQFAMPWTVQALDANGNPVANANITFAVHAFTYPARIGPVPNPTPVENTDGSTQYEYAAYFKGTYAAAGNPACNGVSGTAWCQIITTLTSVNSGGCFNEDIDGSGILKNDVNGNGRLDPGDVASVSPGAGVTDATGTAAVTVLYPQDHAEWVRSTLTATATVQGTESSTSSSFVLPVLASDLTSADVSPPGFDSPYGVASICSNPN
jgi:Bacterial Ig-like domain (group 1)